MFTGWLHEEMMANNLLAPGDAARFWKGLFISGIDFLLRESKYIIEIDALPGNHGRMTKQMHFADPTGTSLETFAYHAIAGRYEDNPPGPDARGCPCDAVPRLLRTVPDAPDPRVRGEVWRRGGRALRFP
jgi:hypothetical protein